MVLTFITEMMIKSLFVPYISLQDRTAEEAEEQPSNAMRSTHDFYRVEDLGNVMLPTWSNVARSDPLKMNTRNIIIYTSADVFAGSGITAITLRTIVDCLCRDQS